MKRKVFEEIAKRFIEYLKEADFSQVFKFTLNDGSDDFDYGIKLVNEFDNWIFVTSMYGDGSAASVSNTFLFIINTSIVIYSIIFSLNFPLHIDMKCDTH